MRPRELLERARRIQAEREAMINAVSLDAAKARLLAGIDPEQAPREPGPIGRDEAERLLDSIPPGARRELLRKTLRFRVEWVQSPHRDATIGEGRTPVGAVRVTKDGATIEVVGRESLDAHLAAGWRFEPSGVTHEESFAS